MKKIGPILPPLVGLTAGRQAGRRNTGGFQNFKTSIQVKLLGILFVYNHCYFTAVLELHSVGFCEVKVYFKVCFEVQKIC